MKKRKLTLEDMSETLKWSIVIIECIITIVSFVLGCLTENLLFLIPFTVFFLGTVIVSLFDCEIYNFLKQHLPRKYFYNAGFSYAIRKDGWIKLNIKTITIDGEKISTKDRNIHIKELFEMVENGTEIYLDGTSEYYSFSKYKNLHLLISKKDLIEYLAPKHDENRLIDCKWEIDITCEEIYITNNLMPNEGIKFFSNQNNLYLLKRILQIPKETILDYILNDNHPILPELTNDDYYTNFIYYWRNEEIHWQPIEFGTTFTQTEPSNIQEEQISISTDTPIGKLVQEIDEKLKQGYVFENIDVNRWSNVYRKMCVQAMVSSYSLSEKQEEKLLNILHSLKDNMYDAKEKQYHTDMDVNIQTMEELLKLDGINSDFKLK